LGAPGEDRHLVRRFLGETVREKFVHQLKRMKNLNTIFLVEVSADGDPASRASRNNYGGACLADIL
jgi:hypothetical protein